jgi:hypothetical protein
MDETIYAAVDRGPVAQERPTVFDVSQRSGRGKREPTCIGSCHVGPVEVARGQRPQPAQVPTLRTSTGAGYLDTAHWLACIASGALISGLNVRAGLAQWCTRLQVAHEPSVQLVRHVKVMFASSAVRPVTCVGRRDQMR